MQSECSQNVVRIKLECSHCYSSLVISSHWYSLAVIGSHLKTCEMQSDCTRMSPECSQNVVRMLPECSQSVVRIKPECSHFYSSVVISSHW